MEMNTTSKILAGVCFVLGIMVFMDGTGDITSAFGPENGPGYGPGYGPQTPNNGPYNSNNQGPAPYGPNLNQPQGPGYGPGYGPESGYPQQPNNGYNEPGYSNNGYNNGGYNNSGYSQPGYNNNGYNEAGYSNNGYGPQQQPGPQQQYYNQTIQSGEVMLDEPTEPDGW